MVLFTIYAYYQFYLLIEGILNLDFDDFNDQTCNAFCARSISITIVPLILFGFLLYQRRFVSFKKFMRFLEILFLIHKILESVNVFSVHSRCKESGVLLLLLSYHIDVSLLVIWSNWCIH